jgi:phosphomannomutase
MGVLFLQMKYYSQRDISKVFQAYDIRGIVGTELDTPMVIAIAGAYGDYLCPDKPGHFVLGHDARWSSPALAEAASVGLRESGHKVTHIGFSSTPMVYWYGAEGDFDGSIAVSASHLPPHYNGLKLCERDAIPLSSDHGLQEIAAKVQKSRTKSRRHCSELLWHISPLALYVNAIKPHLNPHRIIRIAVDAGGGVEGIATEVLLSSFDMVELWPLGFHPDGYFRARAANPLEEGALDQLSLTVKKYNLDFGVAFDGDADRLVAVDEKGIVVPPDALGGLIALHFLKNNKRGNILYDLRASRALVEEIKVAGGSPIRTRVGHAFIKRAMRDQDAFFALELSGHYYYADLYCTDNGLRTLVELLNIVSSETRPLSQLIKRFLRYPTSSEINVKVKDRQRVLSVLEHEFEDAHIDHLDGLSVDYPGWWFNVRSSNTEPILRLNIGAINKKLLDEKQKLLLVQIQKLKAS